MNTILREFKRRNFTVRAVAVEDTDLDLSFDDDGSVRAGLESGELCSFGVVVTVYCRGAEVGQDSLCGCIYKRPEDFIDHYGMRGKGYGSYFSDMVRSSIAEARKMVADFKTVYLRK